MSDSARRDLAIQTYCLRGYTDSRVVAQKVADLGLAHVELHAGDPDVFLEAGIGIVSTGVTTLSGDADAMRATLELPRRLGLGLVSADFRPAFSSEAFRTAERVAGEMGLRLALHNHGGGHWLGSEAMLELLLRVHGPGDRRDARHRLGHRRPRRPGRAGAAGRRPAVRRARQGLRLPRGARIPSTSWLAPAIWTCRDWPPPWTTSASTAR